MRQLNALDSMFLYLDSAGAPMTGGFLQLYAPLPRETAGRRYQRLLRHFARCLDASPVFRRVLLRSPLDLDHAWFAEVESVDLDHHIRRHALEAPGNSAQLHDAYAAICSTPMDVSKPLWEIHVVDGVNGIEGVPRNAFALIVKFHHAAVDGGAANDISAALHSTTPERTPAPRRRRTHKLPPPAAPALPEAARSGAARYLRFGTALSRELSSFVSTQAGSIRRQLLQREQSRARPAAPALRAPRSLFNNVVLSKQRSYTHLSVPLAQIRAIRADAPGATVNDVYLAAVGGGLRRYLGDRDALPRTSLVAACTVNVRSENAQGEGGNAASFIRVPLGTDTEDSARRLQAITAATAAAKAAIHGQSGGRDTPPADWPTLVPAPLLLLIGIAATRLKLTTHLPPPFNLCVTNVPGPREVLYLDGCRMLDFSGAPMLFQGFGITINANSYADMLQVSLLACRKLMPPAEIEKLRDCIADCFAELAQAAAPPARAKRRAPAKPARPRAGR